MSVENQNNIEDRLRPNNPMVRGDFGAYDDYEELYPVEEYTLTTLDTVLLAVRCAIVLLFLITFILVRVTLSRGLDKG